MEISSNYKNKRDPNEITKTLTDVLSKYKGYILGMSDTSLITAINESDLNKAVLEAESVNTLQKPEEIRIENARRSIFASLLDTSIGAYYTHDIINENGVFSGMEREVLGDIDDYLMILCDVADIKKSAAVGNANIFLKDDDNKTGDGDKATAASFKAMIREHSPIENKQIKKTPTDTQTGDISITAAQRVPLADIVNVNGKMTSPSAENKKASAFVIKDRAFCYGNKRIDHMSLFFNGITNLELSRCTPYIEIEVHNRKFEGNTKYYLNPTGYMKFNEGFSGDKSILVPEQFANLSPVSGEGSSDPRYDVSFMDMFTSPQTAVNANINSSNADPSFSDFNQNEQKALEPFAPQATLKDITLTTKSAGQGFVSKKAGSMSLTIHDRSRIKDFAPLISINQLAGARMKITFGWSHPDSSVGSDNLIGRFLDSMKSSQFYLITSSDMRFENNGVDVTVQLISTSMQNFLDVPAAAGTLIPLRNIAAVIENSVDAIIAKKARTGNTTTFVEPKSVKLHPRLDLLMNTVNSNYALVSSNKYIDLLSKIEQGNNNDIIKAVGSLLKINTFGYQLPGTEAEEANNLAKNLKMSVGKKLTEKYETLFHINEENKLSQPDYFTSRCLVNGSKPSDIHKKYYATNTNDSNSENLSYCSLGKIIANFVASPLIATGEYTEVQLFFYPLNNSCGAARIHTTASLPFAKTEIATLFESEEGEDESSQSVSLGSLTTMTFFKKIAALTQTTDFAAYGLEEYSAKQINKNVETEFERLKDVEYTISLTQSQYAKKQAATTEFYNKLAIKDRYSGIGLSPSAVSSAIAAELERLKVIKDKKAKKEKALKVQVGVYLNNYASKIKGTEDDYNSGTKEQKESILKFAIKDVMKESAKTDKFDKLREIYNSDGLPNTDVNSFKLPDLDIIMEAMPVIIAPDGKETINSFTNFLGGQPDPKTSGYYLEGSILKIHIVDKSTLGSEKPELASQILFGGGLDVRGEESEGIIANGVNNLTNRQLKNFIKSHYATVVYGSNNSTVKSINVSSTTSDRIGQAKFMTLRKQIREGIISKSDSTIAEEVRVVPASIDLQMYGCPFIDRGQIIFIDMGTDTLY